MAKIKLHRDAVIGCGPAQGIFHIQRAATFRSAPPADRIVYLANQLLDGLAHVLHLAPGQGRKVNFAEIIEAATIGALPNVSIPGLKTLLRQKAPGGIEAVFHVREQILALIPGKGFALSVQMNFHLSFGCIQRQHKLQSTRYSSQIGSHTAAATTLCPGCQSLYLLQQRAGITAQKIHHRL